MNLKTKRLLYLMLIFVCAHTEAQVINIETKTTSLILNVEKNKKLTQVHFGKRIKNLTGIENLSRNFGEIYPSFGNGSSNDVALIATHADGTMATDLYYQSHESSTQNGIYRTVIHLKDEKLPFYVDLHFTAYFNENIIEQNVVVHHNEAKEVTLEKIASSAVQLKAESYYLTHFFGAWAKEMNLVEEKLVNGTKNIETKRGVRTTEYENPSFVLSLNQNASDNNGEIIMGALAWGGNFSLGFQIEDEERCQMVFGINPFASDYRLAPNTKFETPKMVLTYSENGKNQASINMHRWARKYNLQDGDQERPIVLNSWEGAYFSFDANKLTEMMDGASEMGVEMFVLDDGWFGNKYPRNNAGAGLGDWQINKKKLPEGIDYLIDHAESKGLKFGIWVEPEMVNPKSELAENHPEWIVKRKNGRRKLLERGQLLLDLSNPKVQDFVFGVVDNLLTKHPRISYIKWDANRHVQNFGSDYLPNNKQSHLWIEYAKGLESVFARLSKKYPNTIFQACASGGGRVEYATLKHTHEFWASDDTDPYQRLFIQWGSNHIYPAIATGAHVTKSPSHQTGRNSSLKFRFDVAMAGRLGLELRPVDLEEKQIKFAKKAIKTYKQIRPIVQFGDLYRLLSPYDSDGYMAINYVDQQKEKALLMVYSHDYHRRTERNFVKMQGLNPNANYKITEINKDQNWSPINENGKTISGELLMSRGIKVNLKRPLTSCVLLLEKIN